MGIHTVRFIAEVQKRPCLWNNNLENYSSNKLAKQQAWDEIAQIMFENWSTRDATFRTEKLRLIQKKWKGLRDYFARARNSAPKPKNETDRRKRRKAPSLRMLQFLSVTKPDDGAAPEPEPEDSDSSYLSSRTKIQVHIETEHLIATVHSKPCLWNINLSEFNDKEIKTQAWMEIAGVLCEDYINMSERNKREILRHLQKKWKGLRDYFTRQKSKERMTKGERTRKRKAPYLTMLQFLDIPKAIQEDEDSQGGEKFENNDDTHAADSDVSQSSFTWSRDNQPREGKRIKKNRNIATNIDSREQETDADMNFLLNILPDMKSMTRRQNFNFRFEVMKLIKNIKYRQRTEFFYSDGPGTSARDSDVPQYNWHTSDATSSGKPPFRHQVIIHEYPRKRDDGDKSNDSGGSSVEDIKAILQESSEEQSD